MQVVSLVAEGGQQPSQAQKELMLRNQGLLRFVEQDYKGLPLSLCIEYSTQQYLLQCPIRLSCQDVYAGASTALLQYVPCVALRHEMHPQGLKGL